MPGWGRPVCVCYPLGGGGRQVSGSVGWEDGMGERMASFDPGGGGDGLVGWR